MPILKDIRDHKVLGPYFKMGPLVGERTVVRLLIGARFGVMPPWVEERLYRLSAAELQAVIDRLLDAKSLEELLQ